MILQRLTKRMVAATLVTSMAFSVFTGFVPNNAIENVQAADIDTSDKLMYVDETVMNSYGLKGDAQDGVILHCWDWSYKTIEANIDDIAAAGYSSIQVSPIQEAKESTKGKTNAHWWVLYQPAYFRIDDTGNSALGTKDEFKHMVQTCHEHGVKVIVDIVANHTANESGYDIGNAVDPDIKNNASSTYHSEGFEEIGDYKNRFRVTHYSMGGLPDLNTENATVQSKVYNLLVECIDCGTDGFRFDAAKHIGVEAEGSSFWTNTLVKAQNYASNKYSKDIYAYGEVLDGACIDISNYTNLMSVTDNSTSSTILSGVQGNARKAATTSYDKGEKPGKAVLWNESHDTYQGIEKVTTYVEQKYMDKAWAMCASKANATSLYYVRTNGYRTGSFGACLSNNWKDAEVVAVNKFHNYYHGTSEYLGYSGNYAYNVRNNEGIVIVNCSGESGDCSITLDSNIKIPSGTYTDQVTGNTFTISGQNVSGKIGSSGVAVVYNADPEATCSMSSGTFKTNTITLKFNLVNATSGTYKIGSEPAVTFTEETKVTIGEDMAVGDTKTVVLTATNGKKTTSNTYEYTKSEYVQNIAMINKPSNWESSVYCYAYDEDGHKNAKWPGELMTLDSNTGYYTYTIPDNINNPKVIFYASESHRYPGDSEPGLAMESDGVWLFSNNKWTRQELSVNASVLPASTTFNDTIDVTVSASNATSSTYKIGDGKEVSFTNSKTFTIGADMKEGQSVTVTVSATDGTKTSTKTATYTKKKAFKYEAGYTYFQNVNNWSKVYAYTWKDGSSKKAAAWPGETMTLVDEEKNIYSYPTNDAYDMIIFNNKSSQTADLDIPTVEEGKANLYVYGTGWKKVDVSKEEDPLVNTSYVAQEAICGEKVVFKGSATGGDGNYKFAYYYRKTSDTTWQVAGTEWGTAKYATFKPGYAEVYEVCIKVMDGNNNQVKKYLSFAANKSETSLVCNGKVAKTIYKYGNTNVINASSEGATGSTVKYKYEFRKASSWTYETIKDYTTDTSVNWDAPQTGSFTIRITANDGNNIAIRTINIKVKK